MIKISKNKIEVIAKELVDYWNKHSTEETAEFLFNILARADISIDNFVEILDNAIGTDDFYRLDLNKGHDLNELIFTMIYNIERYDSKLTQDLLNRAFYLLIFSRLNSIYRHIFTFLN